jgi:hypothetical protein
VREESDIALDPADAGYYPVHSRADLLGRLATRTSILKEEPTRRHLVDLLGCQPLVFPIVPLD